MGTIQPSIPHPSVSGLPVSLFLAESSGEALPGHAVLPLSVALLGVGEGVRTGLSVSNGHSWVGYRQNWTGARASRVFGREAATMPSSTGTSTARAVGPSVCHLQY